MLSFYILAVVLLLMVAYAGVEETLRVIRYVDLTINYQIIRFKMWRLKRKLERELGLPPRDWEEGDI